jgi:hypothetical protein
MGNSRLLRSSYVWFFAVPPLASLLSRVGTEHTLQAFGSSWKLHLDLPFSWKVFYFAAVAFAIGATVFALRCPEIIRRYDSFAQFTAEGKGPTQVRDYFLDYIARRRADAVAAALVVGYVAEFTSTQPTAADASQPTRLPAREELIDLVMDSPLDPLREADAFWFVYKVVDRANPVAATLTGLFFLAGLVLVALVLGQNFVYVWNLTF